jgi:hypothetical protein
MIRECFFAIDRRASLKFVHDLLISDIISFDQIIGASSFYTDW